MDLGHQSLPHVIGHDGPISRLPPRLPDLGSDRVFATNVKLTPHKDLGEGSGKRLI